MASAEETEPAPGQSILDPETLRRLIRDLEETDVDELEVVAGSSRLYLRRDPGAVGPGPFTTRAAGVGVGAPREVPVPRERPVQGTADVPVLAPLAGVFYTRHKPELPPIVEVGDPVEAGQVVGLIETMKIFNDVTVDISGAVSSVIAGDGDLVESGQPLMYILPRQDGEPV